MPKLNTLHKLSQISLATIFFALLLVPVAAVAQEDDPPQTDYSKLFDKIEVMIPTRDGVKLHTEVYAPKNATTPLPIVLERTPYGLNDDKSGFSKKLARYEEMFSEGYIFAFQDIRGRYGSEGTFVMQRPVRDPKNPKA